MLRIGVRLAIGLSVILASGHPAGVFILLNVLQSEKWPLSQKAHKSIGECSVCQLYIGHGTVHRHGPGDYRCPGSDKPPVAVAR